MKRPLEFLSLALVFGAGTLALASSFAGNADRGNCCKDKCGKTYCKMAAPEATARASSSLNS